MAATYTTADNVARLLQTTPFSATTTPTTSQVEAIIERKESRIDQKLAHAWRDVTVTDEYLTYTSIEQANGVRFDLKHYTISDIINLEVWNGNEYEDYLVSKTEGRDKDYWVDYDLGVLYIRATSTALRTKPVKITYVFGESVVTGEIEDLATLMTAVDVLSMYQRNIRFADDGGSSTQSQDQRITLFKEDIKELNNSLSSITTF